MQKISYVRKIPHFNPFVYREYLSNLAPTNRSFSQHKHKDEHSDVVLFHQNQRVAFVELNRPKALNALNLEMSRRLNNIRVRLETELDANTMVFKNKGKAFCSGGDLKLIHQGLSSESNVEPKNGKVYVDAFRAAYTFSYFIRKAPQVQVSLWDGLVMGAGVGFSIYGPSFRVATENTTFAMPECGIGLFPDVGASYWLSRLPEGYGRFIGMTGAHLNAADLLHTTLATHFIESKFLPEVEKELVEQTKNLGKDFTATRQIVGEVLSDFQKKSVLSQISSLQNHHELIQSIFGESKATTAEEIFQNLHEKLNNSHLDHQDQVWVKQVNKALSSVSPTSLKLTVEHIKRGKDQSLADCFNMEFGMLMECLVHHDFYEGLNALLVRKNKASACWKPSKLSEISEESIQKYFKSPPEELSLGFPYNDKIP